MLSVLSLASGSSGNATLVQYVERAIPTYLLIDAGIGVRRLNAHLNALDLSLADLSAMVLTHEHVDHALSAVSIARKHGVPIIANRATLDRVITRDDAPYIELPTGESWVRAGLRLETFAVSHDAAEAVGVSVHGGEVKVSLATDLGCITPAVREGVQGADLLICEANHDVHRLLSGPYPEVLKQRILSDRGHLSNEAAVAFLSDHLADKGPCTIWLAHLSKVNNLPKLALDYARATLKLAAGCPFGLDIALRDRPSAQWYPGKRPVQLSLL